MTRDANNGWTRQTFISPTAFRIPYSPDHALLARRLRTEVLDRRGFAVVSGTPAGTMSTPQAQEFATSMLRHFGEPLMQGRGPDTALGWLVRDEGASAYTDDRRFHENAYTSESRGYLHLHNDRAVQPFGQAPDCIALLAHRKAAQGGASVLVDGWTLHRILRETSPHALDLLSTPYPVDRRHVTPHGESPVVRVPVFEHADDRVQVRCNLKRIRTAAELTGAPLPPEQRAALETLGQVPARPELKVTIPLQESDCLVIDDRRVLHGRTSYVDHPDTARRRCLIRVMLRVPARRVPESEAD
ncbi:TauD/TfdA family dioxygenase (plasmid) [Streptomyces sp. BHT-5-2]|uniref:TauD/TfdA family dioxygenase n=1 Tax=Streptomyces sp. BHT-5-2 TaxID=2866715 RepID=UPI001C8EEB99|nr:TauD/TfdA family dioxygenase [Streptomyces sp. BHT-5-2]QZL08978.1 TauD/TfdA family dioxygenase [Streptomyces sp. BHT-5-2]